MKYIKKIGVELEGGWNSPPPTKTYHDGSVNVSASIVGETCSLPSSLRKAKAWIKENYPVVVDSSCGLHFHFSFRNNLSYSRLMTENFHNLFLCEVEKWGKEKEILSSSPFWDRLYDRNKYCRKKFIPDAQSVLKEKREERYAHLNYCYALHKTLEIRLFPMFKKVDLAISALEFTVEIIEKFLSNCKREKCIKVVLKDDVSPIQQREEVICA